MSHSKLRALTYEPLKLGSIRPMGWLGGRMRGQAEGLTGHLDEFWPDVRDSAWIGGSAEGWERAPYWLDGLVPLAFGLNDEALIAKAKRWIDSILDTQHPDGWLGPLMANPDQASRQGQYDVWPRFIILKVLTQWHEATGDRRVMPAMGRFFKRVNTLLDERPLAEWAKARWADLVVSLHWLFDRTGERSLLKLAAKVHRQGLDWRRMAEEFPYTAKQTQAMLDGYKQNAGGVWLNDDFGFTHGVNAGMGVKALGVWSRQSPNGRGDIDTSLKLIEQLHRHHGQVTGMFSCDEHLAGRSPSQGSELCTVVELMYSLETLLAIGGDREIAGGRSVADLLESVAFNALPATISADFWTHQYDQQVNQVVCKVADDASGGRVYTNNGPDANLFGLEPNFGCCTANMHQGWPKFAASLWMRNIGGGLTALSLAPCRIETEVEGAAVVIEVGGNYPFGEEVEVGISADREVSFPLELRIPAWAEGATVEIDGETKLAEAGKMFATPFVAGVARKMIQVRLPMAVRARSDERGMWFEAGALVFALPVGEEWRKLRGEKPAVDYEVHPTTTWNYALFGTAEPELESTGASGDQPFTVAGAPVRIRTTGRRIGGWGIEKNAAATPPMGEAMGEAMGEIAAPEAITLVPYGCARLRVTVFPKVGG